MPAVGETVAVQGLADLQRAFKNADKQLAKGLRDDLKDLAEPVRSTAENLAAAGIPRIGLPWSRMRVGVTARSVYVAPRQRGVRGRDNRRRRANLADLLLGRSMQPALALNQSRIMEGFDGILEDVGRVWERT